MKIKGILFDLDDTLMPSEAIYRVGLRSAWKALNRTTRISWPRFYRLYLQARHEIKANLKDAPTARNRTIYLKRVVEMLFGRSRPALALKLSKAYNTCWREIDPGTVRRALTPLAKRFRLGVVTNQVVEMQLRKMQRIDPDGTLFTVLVTSEEIGVEKPHAEIFRVACRRLGLAPASVLMVGNSRKDDVGGARRVGMRAALWSPKRPHSLPAGVFHLRKLSELAALLRTS